MRKILFAIFPAVGLVILLIGSGYTFYNVFCDMRSHEKMQEYWHDHQRRMTQAKDILVLSKIYSEDHDGRMPKTFSELSGYIGKQKSGAHSDQTPTVGLSLDRASQELIIMSPGVLESWPETIFFQERVIDEHGRRIVGYADGSVSSLKHL